MRPTLTVLEPSLPGRIVDEAMEILARTGVRIDHPSAVQRLESAGLDIDPTTHRVRFPRTVVEKALEDAPSSVTLYDRDGEPHATLEGDHVHFVPRARRCACSTARPSRRASPAPRTSSST